MTEVGVLALQGDFAAHTLALESLGLSVREVRRPAHLDGLRALVLPGGESTALLKLFALERLDEAIVRFHADGGALFGTCAGLILLAREVVDPPQESLRLLDCVVARNAYGRQVDSFSEAGRVEFGEEVRGVRESREAHAARGAPGVFGVREAREARDGGVGSLAAPESSVLETNFVFIRAPRIVSVGPDVQVLARRGVDPVLVRAGRVVGATFHPELIRPAAIHRYFVDEVAGISLPTAIASG